MVTSSALVDTGGTNGLHLIDEDLQAPRVAQRLTVQ
jgi:hypothetical protein